MTIRKATPADAGVIASCLLLAMENIVYSFTGRQDPAEAYEFMHHFSLQENNQYSWQHCYVAEKENTVVAAVNVYDGADLHTQRQPVLNYIRQRYNKAFSPDDETAAGEWYIDSLGVLPAYRGKGIGTAMLQHLISGYVQQRGETLGLLVEDENVPARRLYLKMGFRAVGTRTVFGKKMTHLQCSSRHNGKEQ